MSDRRLWVLLHGECDPELLGVFEEAGDAREAAEIREGGPLAWLDGVRSQDYRVVSVPYTKHFEARANWRRWVEKEAGI